MTHPEDLLLALEDGTIASGDRADLERHLASCAHCRDELALARAARTALATVPDVDAPADLGAPAIAQASGAGDGSTRWHRWGIAAVGIAAAIALVAVVAPKVGSNGDLREAAAASPASAASSAGSPTVERAAKTIDDQSTDYDATSVAAIADGFRGARVSVGTSYGTEAPQPDAGGAPEFQKAARCLDRGSSGAGGELVHLIRATYEGTAAYIGVYVMGAGAGKPADSVRVLVVPVGSCTTILSSAAARL